MNTHSPTLPRPAQVLCDLSYIHEGVDHTIRLDLRSMNDTKRLQNTVYWAMNQGVELFIVPVRELEVA